MKKLFSLLMLMVCTVATWATSLGETKTITVTTMDDSWTSGDWTKTVDDVSFKFAIGGYANLSKKSDEGFMQLRADNANYTFKTETPLWVIESMTFVFAGQESGTYQARKDGINGNPYITVSTEDNTLELPNLNVTSQIVRLQSGASGSFGTIKSITAVMRYVGTETQTMDENKRYLIKELVNNGYLFVRNNQEGLLAWRIGAGSGDANTSKANEAADIWKVVTVDSEAKTYKLYNPYSRRYLQSTPSNTNHATPTTENINEAGIFSFEMGTDKWYIIDHAAENVSLAVHSYGNTVRATTNYGDNNQKFSVTEVDATLAVVGKYYTFKSVGERAVGKYITADNVGMDGDGNINDAPFKWADNAGLNEIFAFDEIGRMIHVNSGRYVREINTLGSNNFVTLLGTSSDAKEGVFSLINDGTAYEVKSAFNEYFNKKNQPQDGVTHWSQGYNNGQNRFEVAEVTTIPLTVKTSKWASACYPVAVTLPTELTGYYASSEEGEYLILTEIEGKVIPANTAVFITTSEELEESKVYNLTIGGESANIENNILKGTTVERRGFDSATGTRYGLSEGLLKKVTGNVIAANKAYYESASANVAAFQFLFDGVSTGVELNASTEKGTYYDLNGRPVVNPVSGVYVINGNKVFVK